MSIRRSEIIAYLNEMAPEQLAESWDNSGLLLAGPDRNVDKVLLCLDVTDQAVETAAKINAGLIISHHPLLFSPLRRITVKEQLGNLIFQLIRNNIDVYCAHTNVDKTYGGLNDLLAGIIGVEENRSEELPVGSEQYPYRIGNMDSVYSIDAFNAHVSARLKQEDLLISDLSVRDDELKRRKTIQRVAVMCGSFDLPISVLMEQGVDAVVSGEMKHHQVLQLIGVGIHVVCAGHHGSERFFSTLLQKWLNERFPQLEVHCVGFDSYPLCAYSLKQPEF